MNTTYNQEELMDLCTEWQDVLAINDWEIGVAINENKLKEQRKLGEVSYTSETAQALISILHPDNYPDVPFPYDMEKTLVHELLHLRFASVAPKKEHSTKGIAFERAIELTAKALVNLKREKCS